MLECLLAAGGRVVSAEELLERVWDEAADPFTTAVKTTIRRLRAKLGDPPVIQTVREGGYRIGEPVMPAPRSLRTRLTLLYAGAVPRLAGAVVLADRRPARGQRDAVHVGSAADRPRRSPIAGRSRLPDLTVASRSSAWRSWSWSSLGLGWLIAGPAPAAAAHDHRDRAGHLRHATCTGGSAGPAATTSSAELGETLDDLFARLEASFESQRHFVANASHELRTPLDRRADAAAGGARRPGRQRGSHCASTCEEVLALGRAAGTAHRRAADPGQQRAGHRPARSRSTWPRSPRT